MSRIKAQAPADQRPVIGLQNLLDEEHTAALLHVSIKTLQGWRWRRTGPRYFKLSNRVRYSVDDLKAYLAQCAIEPAAGREGEK